MNVTAAPLPNAAVAQLPLWLPATVRVMLVPGWDGDA